MFVYFSLTTSDLASVGATVVETTDKGVCEDILIVPHDGTDSELCSESRGPGFNPRHVL